MTVSDPEPPEPADLDRLLEQLYPELRRMAGRLLAGERRDHTLQPTAMVNEVFLRLRHERTHKQWADHEHFFATAARVMRQILVDHARRRGSARRGGGWIRIPLHVELGERVEPTVDLLDLDEALERLARFSPRRARVVELRFFLGMPMEAIASELGISVRSAAQDWTFARTWLYQELSCNP